jgi:hypothetical protein
VTAGPGTASYSTGAFSFRPTDTKEREVKKVRRYRLELVCESGSDEPEETVLRTSTDAARLLAPIFEGADREIGGYHLYLHNTLLDPARQQWPCPILLTSACESCHFLEYDRGGRPHCAAVMKLRTVLDGVDGGESLEELRQWIHPRLGFC